ncbi:hypothetical protein ONZ45_g15183 [Pleurotus djamor]|nr:hypothetical protein ONZ45_g15183 [Pleurotus djamor]
MQPAYLPATGLGLAVVFLLVFSCVPLKKRNFPPGPPRFPIIGNAHQLTSRLWVPMVDWRKIYGPLVYLTAFGQPLVILGTHKVTKDLLDRRAAIYSGRQRSIVAELMTSGYLFPFARSCHSKLYKRMRQAANEEARVVGVRVYRDYFPIQELESSILISSILTSPNNFIEHLKRATGSAMISIIYGGPPVLDPNDPLILLVDSIGEGVNIAALPGSYFVEFFPWMVYLPRWMCPWRVEAENWYIQKSNDLKNLMQGVADREKLGIQTPCIASQLLRDLSESKINEEEAIWTAGTIYTAGVETTAGQMAWFVVAMVLHPSAQREAQIELDRVVGRDRLPSFNDLPQLPYTRAIDGSRN